MLSSMQATTLTVSCDDGVHQSPPQSAAAAICKSVLHAFLQGCPVQETQRPSCFVWTPLPQKRVCGIACDLSLNEEQHSQLYQSQP